MVAYDGVEQRCLPRATGPDEPNDLSRRNIKTNVVESAETIARRIEEAAKTLGDERIAFVNPDCGFWMLRRSVADRKIQALVEGRDLFEGA